MSRIRKHFYHRKWNAFWKSVCWLFQNMYIEAAETSYRIMLSIWETFDLFGLWWRPFVISGRCLLSRIVSVRCQTASVTSWWLARLYRMKTRTLIDFLQQLPIFPDKYSKVSADSEYCVSHRMLNAYYCRKKCSWKYKVSFLELLRSRFAHAWNLPSQPLNPPTHRLDRRLRWCDIFSSIAL